MGTIPKPKRTVTIQMGPHIAVVDSFGNKEPNANWEKEPKLNLNSASTSPKEQRQDNVYTKTLNMNVANENHDSRKPITADMSSSSSSANGGNKNSEGLIGRDPMDTGALTGDCGNDIRESPRKSCKATVEEEPPPPTSPKDGLPTCDGALKAHGFDEMSTDPKAERLRHHTAEDFQKCQVSSALAKQTASDAFMPKQDKADSAGAPANKDVPGPVQSIGSDHTVFTAQTAKLEVHGGNFEQQGSKESEISLLKLREGNSGSCVTSPPLNNTELADTKGKRSPVCSEQDLQSQKDSDSSSLTHSSMQLPKNSATSGGQRNEPDPAQLIEGGLHSTGSTSQEMQKIQRGLCKYFKEAATMTASPERWATPRVKCRDAEVQAVVDVCSRSATTSPCHLLAVTALEPCPVITEGDDSPPGACRMHGGSQPTSNPPKFDSLLKEDGVFSDACVQTVVSSRIHLGPLQPTGSRVKDDTTERGGLEDKSCKSQNTGTSHHAGSAVHQDMDLGARPKEPGLHLGHVQKGPLQPVYQINIAASSHSNHSSSSSFHEKEQSTADLHCLPQSVSHDGKPTGNLHDKPTTSSHECQVVAEIVSLPIRSPSPPRAPACSSQQASRLHVKAQMQPGVDSHLVKPRQVEPLVVDKNTKQKNVQQEVKSKPKSAQSSKPAPSKSKSESCPRDEDMQPKLDQDSSDDESKQGKTQAVPDVVWDEQGMTWEVYGASVDPESLGFAIQSHLLCKIKEHEKQIKTQTTRIGKSLTPESPLKRKTKKRPRNVFRSMLQNVRRPKCCVRVPSSVLE